MILSWNEISTRAKRFSKEWKDANYERGETQSFYNDFFKVFGRKRRDVAIYERAVQRLNNSTGFIDLFWKGVLLVEQKSEGRNLDKAFIQAEDYYLELEEKDKPRYILVSDFQKFELIDLENNKIEKFKLKDFHKHIRSFDFIAGRKAHKYEDQDPVNIKAANIIAELHKSIKNTGFEENHLEIFLTRIVYCLFADDTGIFQPDNFLNYIETRTNQDGSDIGAKITELFQTLDTNIENRQTNIDEDLDSFPYVNGDLFSETIRIPSLDSEMRKKIINCSNLDWSKVSPALFGSLFQTVLDFQEQRDEGAHYTSEKNILKVINSLYLDNLYSEFKKIQIDRSTQKKSRLKSFHNRISKLTFLDPACGCGNFLIIAYRELRILEIEVIKELFPKENLLLDINIISKVNIDQFYGIELNRFAVRIAKVALWLVDHQMNIKLSDEYGINYLRLPLDNSNNIIIQNSLTYDWNNLLSSNECSFILGNPPFIGSRLMNDNQKKDLKSLFADTRGSGDLDYVSGWFEKASKYINNSNTAVSFVSTNSITQGEQVSILWKKIIEDYGIDIFFAHRTFKWTIDERSIPGMHIANVLVVIIGFTKNLNIGQKKLFDYESINSEPIEILVDKINPYLLPFENVFMSSVNSQISSLPEIKFGNMPNDGGHLIFNDDEYIQIKREYSNDPIVKFLKPFVGAREFINNKKRWCLWLDDENRNIWLESSKVREIIDKVKNTRASSRRAATRRLSNTPWLFGEVRQPKSDYILIPRHSSSKRKYIPIGFFDQNTIVGDSCLSVKNGNLKLFSILTSSVNMTWVKYICGRIKDDYRYSIEIVYNNFPFLQIDNLETEKLIKLGNEIIEFRKYSNENLNHLYDDLLMPAELRKIHKKIDNIVLKIYNLSNDATELEIMTKLLELRKKIDNSSLFDLN